jgi:hypothetical protein
MEHETDRDDAARPMMGPASPADEDGRPEERERPHPGAAGAAGAAVAPVAPVAPVDARRETGEPRVDAALRLLDRLPGLPVSDHPELFEQVHAQLTDVLGELDSGSAGPADAHGS